MIEAVQLPLLLKAIDFVFDEGRKILQERRERRKMTGSAAADNEVPENEATEIVPIGPEKAAEVKQELSTSKVDELLWQHHEKDVKHLVSLLESHTKNYYILKEQYAKWGSVMVPPVIVIQLEEKEDAIIETKQQLEALLTKIYKKDIQSTQLK